MRPMREIREDLQVHYSVSSFFNPFVRPLFFGFSPNFCSHCCGNSVNSSAMITLDVLSLVFRYIHHPTDLCRSFRGHDLNPKSPSYDVQAHRPPPMNTQLAPTSLNQNGPFLNACCKPQAAKLLCYLHRRDDSTDPICLHGKSTLAGSPNSGRVGIRMCRPIYPKRLEVMMENSRGPLRRCCEQASQRLSRIHEGSGAATLLWHCVLKVGYTDEKGTHYRRYAAKAPDCFRLENPVELQSRLQRWLLPVRPSWTQLIAAVIHWIPPWYGMLDYLLRIFPMGTDELRFRACWEGSRRPTISYINLIIYLNTNAGCLYKSLISHG